MCSSDLRDGGEEDNSIYLDGWTVVIWNGKTVVLSSVGKRHTEGVYVCACVCVGEVLHDECSKEKLEWTRELRGGG